MPKSNGDTLAPPRYKHFTLDPNRPIGSDVDQDPKDRPAYQPDTLDGTPPSAAFSEDEAEQLKALSDAQKEAHDERAEQERKDAEAKAKSDEPAPKPSELLASQQGAGTDEKSKESKKAESKS